ncbi:hypothetical protein [Klebsiella pneumoniae]|uniref:hypothetical protein n=1 Tax=Klebsiella pneumoniae TaxID=573 RepID=UPI0022CE1A86|nr:hypothetical protein [Klebsiella pneumoniae]
MTDSENWPVYAGPPPRAAQGRRHKRDSHANKTGRSNVAGAVPGSPSGRTPYSTNEFFFQLLLIRNWQQWQEQKAQLGKCRACGKLKAEGCEGERKGETFNCWLAVEANELNL